MELECGIHTLNWNVLYAIPSVDDQVLLIQNNIANLFNNHVPLKRLIINNDRSWFNANIRRSIDERDTAYNDWKHFKTIQLYNIFRLNKVNFKIP